jgi:hypothetical protein
MSDTPAIDHHVVLKPIAVRPISRPTFDNRRLASCHLWITDNTANLARYFKALLGDEPIPERSRESDASMARWLRVQHELEVGYQNWEEVL